MTESTNDDITRIGVGASLSQAVVHGGVVYLAGQVAEDGSADAYEQTRSALAAVDAQLAKVGSSRSRLLRVIVWLPDIGDFAAMDQAWREWLGETEPPARATAQATLADPSWKVEIIAEAALPAPADGK